MTFPILSQYFAKLEATTKRLEITAILVDLIKSASADEIDKILYLTNGRLGPLFDTEDFNIADKMMIRILAVAYNKKPEEINKLFGKLGDLGNVSEEIGTRASLATNPDYRIVGALRAKPVKISVEETYNTLSKIAFDDGSGSQDRKVQKFATLLKQMDPVSAKYLVRIPLGKLRLGFSDITVLDALSFVEAGDKSARTATERAYNIYPDIGKIAKIVKAEGVTGLKKIRLLPGVPVLPQRCSLVTSSEEMLEKATKWAVQPKYDGLRVQIHYGVKEKKSAPANLSLLSPTISASTEIGSEAKPSVLTFRNVRIFSRGLEDITNSMPEIVKSSVALAKEDRTIKNFILDGEAITFDNESGKLLPFDETVTRKRKYGISEKVRSTPLKVFVFDLLLLDGEDLTQKPYSERYKELTRVVGADPCVGPSQQLNNSTILLTSQQVLSDPEKISKFFSQETKEGLEGIVAKKLDSPYQAGARNFSWVKMKRIDNQKASGSKSLTDTIDCVVLGYYLGEGKRNDFGIGAFLVGLYDSKDDTFKTVAKIGTGLTDEQWRELKAKCDKLKTVKKPTRYITPTSLVPHIWVEPKIVVAVRADQVTKSPMHTSGISLRFPRLMAYREKLPEDANTVEDIKKLVG